MTSRPVLATLLVIVIVLGTLSAFVDYSARMNCREQLFARGLPTHDITEACEK